MMKNINLILIKFFVLFFIVGFFISCHSKSSKNLQTEDQSNKSAIVVETFKSDNGWGYEIKVLGKTKFKQAYIPAIGGNLPFDSEMDAQRVAELVVKKMKKRSLPSITKHELDSLMIKY